MLFTYTDDDLGLLDVIGTWVSAFGSIAAAVVALYLANRSGAQKLTVRVAVVLEVISTGGGQNDRPIVNRSIQFYVVNVGDRPVRIINLGWQVGLFKKKYAMQKIPPHLGNSSMPVDLQHGESAHWSIALNDTSTSWEHEFADKILRDAGPARFLTLRGSVQTSLGKSFLTRPEDSLLERFKKAYEALV